MMHHRSLAHLLLGQYEDAALWASKAIRQPNTVFWTHALSAASLGHLGRVDEARAALDEVLRVNADFTPEFVARVFPFKNSADAECLLDGLRAAGLTD